jgi:cytochrome c oxidase assembly protein subunit 15
MNVWLHRYAILVAACTLLLIFVGGLVTTTGSGLAVPDWPLSFGQVFPEMVGGVRYEHGHRLVAATVGLLTVILALWLWKSESRRWVRRLGTVALATVILQGVLGGITVLLLLPTAVSLSHAALAQVFLCLTLCLAVFTSRSWQEDSARIEDAGSPSLKALAVGTTAMIYVQILIGAWMRHTGSGLAIPDFPLSYGHVIPPFFTRQILIHFAHRVGALLVIVLALWLALRILRMYRSERALLYSALFLLFALALQVALGIATIWSSRALIPTTLHVAVGGLTLASSLYLTLRAQRILLPRPTSRTAQTAFSGATE